MTNTLTLHVEKCTFTLSVKALCEMTLKDFRNAYKKAIKPAAESDQAINELLNYMNENYIEKKNEKKNILTGTKSEKTEHFKIIKTMVKQNRFMIQYDTINNVYYLCDAFRILVTSAQEYNNACIEIPVLKDLRHYAMRDSNGGAQLINKEPVPGCPDCIKLYKRLLNDHETKPVITIDMSRAESGKTDNIKHLTYKDSDIVIRFDETFIKYLKNKTLFATGTYKPAFTPDYKYLVLPMKI